MYFLIYALVILGSMCFCIWSTCCIMLWVSYILKQSLQPCGVRILVYAYVYPLIELSLLASGFSWSHEFVWDSIATHPSNSSICNTSILAFPFVFCRYVLLHYVYRIYDCFYGYNESVTCIITCEQVILMFLNQHVAVYRVMRLIHFITPIGRHLTFSPLLQQ